MKKEDFLFYLKKALKGEIPADKVKYHVNYYQKYIDEEVRNGKKQSDVIDMLGDPQLIAKSIIESERMSGSSANYADYSDFKNEEQTKRQKQTIRQIKIEGIIGIIVFIFFLILIIAAIWGLFTLVARLFIPILLVILVVSVIKKLR